MKGFFPFFTFAFLAVWFVVQSQTKQPIQYPADIDPSNFVWGAQSSTDMVHWIDEPYERSNDTLIVHINGRPNLFLRVKGYPQ